MTSRMSFVVPLPSPDFSSCSRSSPAARHHHHAGAAAVFALPSPPCSQGSPSSLCPSDSASARRASTCSTGSHQLVECDLSRRNSFFELGLDIDNRAQMHTFMRLDTRESDCIMAAEVISLLIPNASTAVDSMLERDAEQKLLARYLLYWTSLTPHGLCVLIGTVVLLERLRGRHPGLSATGQVKDTILRVVFSAYLTAMKLCTEVSYLNSAFVGRTPWTNREMGSMERELQLHLDYDCFVPADQIVQRAQPFWRQRELAKVRQYRDDGAPELDVLAGSNNFFRDSTFSAAYL